MRNVLRKFLFITTICSLVYTMPVFAETEQKHEETKMFLGESNSIQLENKYISKARGIDNARGTYISSSIASIENVGNGVIGITATTTAHRPVDKIRIHIYLDKLNENEKWIQVDDFDYYFYPEDEPDGELTKAIVGLEVDDQPSGYYYRVRGTHGVWKNGVSESQSTRSNGVLITNP